MMNPDSKQFIEIANQHRDSFNFAFVFKQQLLQNWHPKINTRCAAIVYVILAVIFIAMGIGIFAANAGTYQSVWRYDDKCQNMGTPCIINFQLSNTVTSPIYVYYSISGFYQNHKTYTTSITNQQIMGGRILPDTALSTCAPIIYNKDTSYTSAVDGTPLDPYAPAFPCGLIASSFFNDTFTVVNTDTNLTVPITFKGISYPNDLNNYQNANLSLQWMDMKNERFVNWIQLALFSSFQKAWGLINANMALGNYKIVVGNNWNAALFNGTKSVIISQLSAFGGASDFLGYSYVCIGALSFVLSIVLVFKGLRKPKGIVEENQTKVI